MAKKEIEKSVTGEVINAPVKPLSTEGLKAIADWYFLLHNDTLQTLNIDTIIVCDDGEIFYDNVKGANAAINYCAANKIGSKQFKNPL